MKLLSKKSVIFCLIIQIPAFLLIPVTVHGSSNYSLVNSSIVENHILPGYASLTATSESFHSAVNAFCTQPENATLDELRARYHDLASAWMQIQHIRTGPVELFLRPHRFYFWPQARGKVVSAIQELLERNDDSIYSPQKFSELNVAVQGLLAAEVLLYGDFDVTTNAMACQLLKSVAKNMRDMATDVLKEWEGGEISFVDIVSDPKPEDGYYSSHKEVTLDLFKSLHDGLQFIAEVKLKPVISDSVESVRPYFAESRLSGRSHLNIIYNLRALQDLYQGEQGMGLSLLAKEQAPKLDELMHKAFRLTLENANSIDAPVELAAADIGQRERIEKLLLQVRALQQIVRVKLAEALAFPVGFNSLDGD